MIDLLVFDLDGTLADSRGDIAAAVNELRAVLDRPPLPEERIYGFIGNGVRVLLERSLEDAFPVSLDDAVARYLPIYRRRLLDTTRAYPGVREALSQLEHQATLAVLTNKPRPESVLLLEGLDLARHFQLIYGGEDFPERKPHPMALNALIEETGRRRQATLLVGDSLVDLETARNGEVAFCLVDYGEWLARNDVRLRSDDLRVSDLRNLAVLLRDR